MINSETQGTHSDNQLTWMSPIFYHLFMITVGKLLLFMQLPCAAPSTLSITSLWQPLLSVVQKVKWLAKLTFTFSSFAVLHLWSSLPRTTSSFGRVLKKFRPKDRHSHFINKVWINRNWGERNIFPPRPVG